MTDEAAAGAPDAATCWGCGEQRGEADLVRSAGTGAYAPGEPSTVVAA